MNILIFSYTQVPNRGWYWSSYQSIKWWSYQILSEKIPGLEIKTIEDFKSNARLNVLIQKAIHRANSKAIANPHKVQTFKILPLDLSLSGGELGPTMKSKRHFIVNKYSDYIAQMYRGDLP